MQTQIFAEKGGKEEKRTASSKVAGVNYCDNEDTVGRLKGPGGVQILLEKTSLMWWLRTDLHSPSKKKKKALQFKKAASPAKHTAQVQ